MKYITKILAIILVLAPLSAFAPVADDEEDVYYILTGEADRAIADGDFATAVERIKDALNVDPSNPGNVMLLSNLGILYNQLDQDSLALEAFNHALRMAPSMLTVIENRAMLYLKMGADSAAYTDLNYVLERDSLNLGARFYHGMLSLYHRDLNGATADFDILKSIDPEGHNTNVAMAMYHATLAQYREAIPYYQKLIAAEPLPEYYSALALCYLSLHELSDASTVIADGLKLYPKDGELYYYRAWLRRDSYLMREARQDAQMARSLGVSQAAIDELFK